MKLTVIATLASGFCLAVSCSKEPGRDVEPQNPVGVDVSHLVPLDEALRSLDQVLDQTDFRTRSSEAFRISEVFTYSGHQYGTKSQSGESSPLMYAVNFEEGGFAILAADDRISSDVIALVGAGKIGVGDFEIYEEGDCRLYHDYPLPGEPVPECGDSTEYETPDPDAGQYFFNPNTAEIYDEEQDDYMIGDVYTTDTVSFTGGEPATQFVARLCAQYATDEVASNGSLADTTTSHFGSDVETPYSA